VATNVGLVKIGLVDWVQLGESGIRRPPCMARPATGTDTETGSAGQARRRSCRLGSLAVTIAAWPLTTAIPVRAEGQVQLSCNGTLLEARGQAETVRRTARLQVSLNLGAEGEDADRALVLLQTRLASVRRALQELQVGELRVSSPSTWQRAAEGKRPAAVQANLQVNGILDPARLHGLIRTVGSLPGVHLAPVMTEADRREEGRVRQELLRQAYEDALRQTRPLAALIGRDNLRALEIRIDGSELPMPTMRTMAADAAPPPPFNPEELNQPRQRLGMQVRFCAE
jgi:uncharacterized protein YggE